MNRSPFCHACPSPLGDACCTYLPVRRRMVRLAGFIAAHSPAKPEEALQAAGHLLDGGEAYLAALNGHQTENLIRSIQRSAGWARGRALPARVAGVALASATALAKEMTLPAPKRPLPVS